MGENTAQDNRNLNFRTIYEKKNLSQLLVHTHALPTQENNTTQSKCISEHNNGVSYLCVKPKLNLNEQV